MRSVRSMRGGAVGLFSAVGGPRWRYITASVSQAWPSMTVSGGPRLQLMTCHRMLHGHGHGIFILATYPEGTWSTNPNPLSPSIPAQTQQRHTFHWMISVSHALRTVTDSLNSKLPAHHLLPGSHAKARLLRAHEPERSQCGPVSHKESWYGNFLHSCH